MCYTVMLSTSSQNDLSLHNSEHIAFSSEHHKKEAANILRHQHKWHIGSKSGCSCTFRHLHSIELGFGAPLDWYPEEADQITATLQFIKIIRALVADGAEVDCIDCWESSDEKILLDMLRIDLAQVSDQEFRFFENYHFIFDSSTGQKR